MDEHNVSESKEVAPIPALTPSKPLQSFAIPLAIVLGFGLVAAAVYFSGNNAPIQNGDPLNLAGDETPKTGEIRPVDDTDHVRGNPNAPIVLIEYSDYDCPFCKNFHETMNRVMSTYGTNGKVAWVYRHLPLEQLHPSAPFIAQASECVAELGGNDAFWKFTDLVFGERGTNEQTNTARLEEFAVSSGVGASAYKGCMASGHTKERVDSDFADAVNAGGKGTPYTLVLVGGQQGVISGAQPYETVSKILDTLIAQMENKE